MSLQHIEIMASLNTIVQCFMDSDTIRSSQAF